MLVLAWEVQLRLVGDYLVSVGIFQGQEDAAEDTDGLFCELFNLWN